MHTRKTYTIRRDADVSYRVISNKHSRNVQILQCKCTYLSFYSNTYGTIFPLWLQTFRKEGNIIFKPTVWNRILQLSFMWTLYQMTWICCSFILFILYSFFFILFLNIKPSTILLLSLHFQSVGEKRIQCYCSDLTCVI